MERGLPGLGAERKDACMTNPTNVETGSPAPDAGLRAPSGDPVHLREEWEAAPKALALVFLRHFG